MQQSRTTRYEELAVWFSARVSQIDAAALKRYAAVAEEIFDDERVGAKIDLFDTEQEAFDFLADSVLDGLQADGVYDLDTSEKIDVRVSRPIVTRAPKQGVTLNPLTD